MPHAQQQILAAVQAALVAAPQTSAAANVFIDRVDALQPSELPAILIEEDEAGETVDEETVHGLLRRELLVSVSAMVAHGTAAPANARDLGLQIEKRLASSTALRALCKAGVQIASSRHINAGEADRLMAARLQVWRMTYLAHRATPDTIF